LAIAMVAAFIRAEAASQGERAALKQLERVVAIADDYAAILVFVLYGIDVLQAVPLEAFPSTAELHRQRWPQVIARARSQREALAKLANRVSERPRLPKRRSSAGATRAAGVTGATGRAAAKKTPARRRKPAPGRRR
jgi:hypothetical protein